jgi:2'-5' RNA ligase
MRLFTALDLPEEVRDRYARLQAPGDLDARWTDPDQFHVTLRFIGDADADQAARYEHALAQIDAPAVECVPYGLDALPSRRRPRVLIVGLERTDDLMTVHQSVSEALEGEGLEPEDRTYRPHVTLARLDDAPASAVHDFLDTHDDPALTSFRVDTVHLYESTLTPNGAVHDRRASFSLGP